MNRLDLMARAEYLRGQDLSLMERKNHDYSGDADALQNFRLFGFYGVCVRLSDKLMRLMNYAKTGELAVNDESIRDTLADIRNYATIAEVMLDEEDKP